MSQDNAPLVEAPVQSVAEVSGLTAVEQSDQAAREALLKELGHAPVEAVILPDGQVTTKEEVQAVQEAGQEMSGPYGGGGRR